MTRVHLRQSDDMERHDIAIVDLGIIPRVGEQIKLTGSGEMALPWSVLFVVHELDMSVSGLLEHVVILVLSPLPQDPHVLWVEWQDPSERPGWVPDDCVIECDVIPSRGDLLELGINKEDFNPSDAVIVEIVAVVHNALLDNNPIDHETGIGHIAEMQTALIVRSAEPGISGDVQRIIARRN